MAIRASASRQIDELVADLTDGGPVERDAAVARLLVIGARAVERLVSLAGPGSPAAARIAAFRTLEGIGDDRAVDPALAAIAEPDVDIALAAVSVARVFIRGERGAAVVDRLTGAALDAQRPEPVRVAAVRALRDLEPATVAPLWKSLAGDGHAAVRAEAQAPRERKQPGGAAAVDPIGELARAAQALEEPAHLRGLLAQAGAEAPLSLLSEIVERVRGREASDPAARRAEWMTIRAAAHLALARRGSRIALYDLKESLEKAAALPVDALAAVSLIGDASCLEPIATAWVHSKDAWWRRHLLEVFDAIVKREGITRRHPAMKKIARKWPAFFQPRPA